VIGSVVIAVVHCSALFCYFPSLCYFFITIFC
jgi:hypothetical protein